MLRIEREIHYVLVSDFPHILFPDVSRDRFDWRCSWSGSAARFAGLLRSAHEDAAMNFSLQK